MANIHDKLNKIITSIFGKDVRQALYDGLDVVNKETENTTAKQQHLENTFDQLVINAGTSNAEIVDARVDKTTGKSYSKVGDRMDEVSSLMEQNTKDLSEREINALNYRLNVENTINGAVSRATEVAKEIGGIVILPPNETPYLISETLEIGSNTDQRKFSLIAKSAPGSYYGEKQTTIQRTNQTDTYPMLQVIGRGYLIDNICFDGQGYGDLVICGRGFEAHIDNCRFYRSGNVGLKAYAFQNAFITNCFFDENVKGLVLDYNETFGVCNTVFITGCHFERNTDIDCSIAVGTSGTHWCEFIFFNKCHFESTTNTGGVAKSVPLFVVGNVRNCYLDNSFLYGGKADLLRYDSQIDNGETKYKGLTVTNTSFVGHLTKHSIDENTPPRLINLKNGNGFFMSGCMFDGATSEYVRIENTFGDDVIILPCFISTKRTGSTNIAIRDHRGYEKTIDKMELIPNLVVGHYRSLWEIGGLSGVGDSTELNFRPLVDSRTVSFDTKNGNRVMSMYMNNTAPRWGVFGNSVGKQVITGAKNSNEALDNLIKALAKFGLIEDNTTA